MNDLIYSHLTLKAVETKDLPRLSSESQCLHNANSDRKPRCSGEFYGEKKPLSVETSVYSLY